MGVYSITNWKDEIFTIAGEYKPINDICCYGAYPLSLNDDGNNEIVGYVYNYALELVEQPDNSEFILSERWYIQLTEENYTNVVSWHKSVDKIGRLYEIGSYYGLNCSNGDAWGNKFYVEKYGQIISYEQFKKYVLKNNIMNNKKTPVFNVTREQFKKLFDVACTHWKEALTNTVDIKLGSFGSVCELSYDEVKNMFDAISNDNQKKIMEEVFPNYCKLPEYNLKELITIIGHEFILID